MAAESFAGEDPDVLIVGYGPIGQVVAILLAQSGHRVTVVERWPEPYPMPRAVSFDGESARILAAAGIGDAMAELGEPSRDYTWRNGEGELLFHVDVADRGRFGWPDSTSMYQPGLESALAARGERLPNLWVLRGHRAVTLTDHGDRVHVAVATPGGGRRVFSAGWVVGCDGANSFVRDSVGVTATDLGFFNDWLTCDVAPHEPRPFEPNNLQICDPARPRTAVSAGPGHRRWEFMRLPGESIEDFGRLENVWRLLELFNIRPDNATLLRHSVYTFQARYVDRWRVGRVLLAGDAAHVMPPFAGQGMCSGFRDAANLAWKLDLVLGGRADERLLDTYTIERCTHVQHAVEMSVSLGQVICQTDAATARDRDQVMIASRNRGLGSGKPRAEVRPLVQGVLHRGALGTSAGDLVPQAAVRRDSTVGLFDETVGRGFVLITTEPPDALLNRDRRAFLAELGTQLVHVVPPEAGSDRLADGAVVDIEQVYMPYLAKWGAQAALVRPDFYLFGAVRGRTGLAALVDDLRTQLTTPTR